jgi:hypothetical protein
MRLTGTQVRIGQIALVLLLNLVIYQKSEALFISIENIGGSPITAAYFRFTVEPSQGTPFILEIMSSRVREDPTNIYLQFDEAHPIPIGGTYDTPLIPALTDVTFRLMAVNISGFNIAVVEDFGPIGILVTPDVTTREFFNPNINFGYLISFHSGGVPISIEVPIDIQPNSINPRSRGTLSVAILTTATFDATTINAATIRFGATGTEAAPIRVAVEDVNNDGVPDLLLQFNTQDTRIQCQTISASLTGQTFEGQNFHGSDAIQTIGCR